MAPKCDTCGGEMKPLFSSFFCPDEDKPDHGAQIKLKKDTEESLKAWYRAWGYSFPADLVNLRITNQPGVLVYEYTR